MNLTQHCDLCDHKISDFKKGIICGLTERKPEFNKTCSKISLNQRFEEKVKEINLEFEKFRKAKVLTYTYFFTFIVIGIVVIITGFLLAKHIFEVGYISTIPLIIMVVGLVPVGVAVGTLVRHIQGMDVARKKKEDLDRVLELYRISYDINFKYGVEFHGTQEIYVDLNVKRP